LPRSRNTGFGSLEGGVAGAVGGCIVGLPRNMGDLISAPECNRANTQLSVSSKLAFGLVAGMATAFLTIAMGAIPAIAIGGLGAGIAVRLYSTMRTNRCVNRLWHR
jgi:hypothetical protein